MERTSQIIKRYILSTPSLSFSKERLSFEKAMLDASADCIKVIDADGILLTMNRAGCRALGVPEDSTFGMPWLPLLPASVHAAGHEAIERARRGQTARFPGKSETGGETRYWDNLLTPIVDEKGSVKVILCVSRDITANTLLERELEGALLREKLLAQEMRHRVKNVFAVVSSLISLAEREGSGNGATTASVFGRLRETLGAFSRASDAVFDPGEFAGGDRDKADVVLIVEAVLRPYAGRYRAEGEQCTVSRQGMTALILFLHEMATNSVKYGVLGADKGTVQVSWSRSDGDLKLRWVESGGPSAVEQPRNPGFGSAMIERVARSVGGEVVRSWTRDGLVADLSVPLPIPMQGAAEGE